jgi:hypothetical protein
MQPGHVDGLEQLVEASAAQLRLPRAPTDDAPGHTKVPSRDLELHCDSFECLATDFEAAVDPSKVAAGDLDLSIDLFGVTAGDVDVPCVALDILAGDVDSVGGDAESDEAFSNVREDQLNVLGPFTDRIRREDRHRVAEGVSDSWKHEILAGEVEVTGEDLG